MNQWNDWNSITSKLRLTRASELLLHSWLSGLLFFFLTIFQNLHFDDFDSESVIGLLPPLPGYKLNPVASSSRLIIMKHFKKLGWGHGPVFYVTKLYSFSGCARERARACRRLWSLNELGDWVSFLLCPLLFSVAPPYNPPQKPSPLLLKQHANLL